MVKMMSSLLSVRSYNAVVNRALQRKPTILLYLSELRKQKIKKYNAGKNIIIALGIIFFCGTTILLHSVVSVLILFLYYLLTSIAATDID